MRVDSQPRASVEFPRMSTNTSTEDLTWFGRRTVWDSINVMEIGRFRSLIWQFALRDLKVRYRQTLIGALWAVIQPVVTMIVFGVLFSTLDGRPTTSGLPYPVTSLCALIFWQFVATSVIAATQSISMNAQLVQKVYFPKIILPLASMIPPLVDLAIAAVVLCGVMIWYGIGVSLQILWLPLIAAGLFLTALAAALWFSAMNALYRDVQYTVPFLISIGLLVSPVTYELTAVLERMSPSLQFVYCLNPFVGLLSLIRWSILDTPFPPLVPLVVSGIGTTILLISGVYNFGRMERLFTDRV